ncbi:MAG TPA: phosphoribosylglycinamide formyltransferase, partial [Deltaproteobacteria bacterium]|nr:phosphoribosylglycinamide formyltransferase [Deltaproteobacteria bacterium]
MKLGVLISGRGSNLRSIIDAVQKDRLNAEIVAVL